MKQDIRLYIENSLVEFSKDPQILFNYKVTDALNPTAVHNSFSKTVTIDGTPTNNKIFGHIWDLSRYQMYGGTYNGVNFNPIKKASFKLYLNSEIYESGYCKLDSISKNGEKIQYSITLYGGLGDFLLNLTYNQSTNDYTDDDTNDTKKTLADLVYTTDGNNEPNMDYYINKDTVWDAWCTLNGNPNAVYSEDETNRPNNYLYDDRWNFINFGCFYNGTPNDFDSSKMLINLKELGFYYPNSITDGDKTYTPYRGYALAEMDSDLVDTQTFDLRSYLQRPVIKFKNVIESMTNPVNNGGFQVKLDSHIFNQDNPYWENSWLTLPMLRDCVNGGNSVSVYTANAVKTDDYIYSIQPTTTVIGNYNSVAFDLSFKISSSNFTYDKLYLSNRYFRKGVNKAYASPIFVQVVAYNTNNEVVGTTSVYMFYTKYKIGEQSFNTYKDEWKTKIGTNVPNVIMLESVLSKSGNYYKICDNDGNEQRIKFSLDTLGEFSYLELIVASGCNKKDYGGGCMLKPSSNFAAYNVNWGYTDSVDVAMTPPIISNFKLIGESNEKFFSGTYIQKKDYLTTEYTPCEYLTSFCKMFGLYLFRNPVEVSDDISKYPNGVIHIMDRDSYYNTNNIVDLDKLIDRSKSIKITPQVPKTKWYNFNSEQTDSEVSTSYSSSYGIEYGDKRVNTGYNFDASTTSLYKGGAFKGGIMVLEKDKYYNKPISNVPWLSMNGMNYYLFNVTDGTISSKDKTLDIESIQNFPINSEGLKNCDAFPKVQFHTDDYSPSDGANVLVFFNGGINTSSPSGYVDYWITDDILNMSILNDSTPCWIITGSENDNAGNTIAYKTNTLPYFTRHITFGSFTGNITHSWDFGNPKETFIPSTYVTNEGGIYNKFWSNYIRDMYDVNTRQLTCYCMINERPNPDWLRRFYWFDNCIWRLNAISDWNITSLDSTQMEFIKVQDLNNYKLDRVSPIGREYFELDQYEIGYEGGTITGRIYIQSGGQWDFAGGEDYFTSVDDNGNTEYWEVDDYINPRSGNQTLTNITITIPPYDGSVKRTFYYTVLDPFDNWLRKSVVQNPRPPYISTVDNVNLDYNANSNYTIAITSNTNYTIEINDNE